MTLSKYLLEKTRGKKDQVLEAVKLIKDHKKKQRALYRSYYQLKEDLDAWIDEFKEQDDDYAILKMYCEIDDQDIFYEKKRKLN